MKMKIENEKVNRLSFSINTANRKIATRWLIKMFVNQLYSESLFKIILTRLFFCRLRLCFCTKMLKALDSQFLTQVNVFMGRWGCTVNSSTLFFSQYTPHFGVWLWWKAGGVAVSLHSNVRGFLRVLRFLPQ